MVVAVQALAGSKEEGEQLVGYRKVLLVDLKSIQPWIVNELDLFLILSYLLQKEVYFYLRFYPPCFDFATLKEEEEKE